MFAASRSAAYTDSDSSSLFEELTGQNSSSQDNYTLNKFQANQLRILSESDQSSAFAIFHYIKAN